jgi:alkylation response protein AidB-like acyl-CoA dehydrogenase
MNFDPTEEQRLLAASIARFVQRDYGFDARNKIVASEAGWSRDRWAAMADLGLLGLPFSSEFGGFGGGAVDMMSTMEAIGDALIVEPYLATVGLGAQFIARAGTPAQKKRVLPAVVEGRSTLAFAHTESGARYDLAHVTTRASRAGDGFGIDGTKRVVLNGSGADTLVVSARVSGTEADPNGIALLLVDAGTRGLEMSGYRTIDGLRAADIVFDGVEVGADALIADEPTGLALIEDVVDFATALICAEAVGAIKSANDATLDYLKTRKQFGTPIGSFQALQHRMVDMVISYEQAKSMASLACGTVDAETDRQKRKQLVSAAKVKIADACRHVSQEAVQLHGGMGMTDEMKISHTFRRLTMIAQQFGDADHHLERFAATSA